MTFHHTLICQQLHHLSSALFIFRRIFFKCQGSPLFFLFLSSHLRFSVSGLKRLPTSFPSLPIVGSVGEIQPWFPWVLTLQALCTFRPFSSFCCHSKYILICHCRSSSLKAWMVFSFMQSKCKFDTSELHFHVGLCYFRRPAHQIPTASPLRQLKQGKNIGLVLLKCSLFPLLSLPLPPAFFLFFLHAIRYAALSPAAASETTVAHREQ